MCKAQVFISEGAIFGSRPDDRRCSRLEGDRAERGRGAQTGTYVMADFKTCHCVKTSGIDLYFFFFFFLKDGHDRRARLL